MANISVTFDSDALVGRIKELNPKVQRVISGVMEYHQQEMVRYARNNAPWTDRTGNARSGLNASLLYGSGGQSYTYNADATSWELILAHSVPYGIYLETRFSGRYAIIEPTVQYIGPLVMQRLSGAFARLS